MIPTDRPVRGRDLEALRQKLGLLVNDFCFLFSISMTKWSKIKRDGDEIVDDPGVAILARLLDEMPSLSVVPPIPSPQDIQSRIKSFPPYARMPDRAFGIFFGRDASASYRWLAQKQHTGPITNRLLTISAILLDQYGQEGVDRWAKVVDIESKARGIEDVWREGLWRQRKPRTAAKTSKVKEVAKKRKGE